MPGKDAPGVKSTIPGERLPRALGKGRLWRCKVRHGSILKQAPARRFPASLQTGGGNESQLSSRVEGMQRSGGHPQRRSKASTCPA